MIADISRKAKIGSTVALLTVILSGCGTSLVKTSEDDIVRDYSIEQIQHPLRLQPGDRFRFDNPDMIWTVALAEEKQLHWENDKGAKQVTTLNPLLPALSWESVNGTGKRLLSHIKGSFFPLTVGSNVNFKSTVSTDKPPYAWEFGWNCSVAGETKVDLPIGIFDTFRIACSRQEPETWTFYYAPRLGYYVMMEQVGRSGGAAKRRILTGYDRYGMVTGDLSPRIVDEAVPTGTIGASADYIAPVVEKNAPPPPMIINENDPHSVAPSQMASEITTEATEATESMMVEIPPSKPLVAKEPVAQVELMQIPEEGSTTTSNTTMEVKKTEDAEMVRKIESSDASIMDLMPTPTTKAVPAAVSGGTIVMAPPPGYYVHLASYSKPKNVEAGWDIIKKKHPKQFETMFPFQLVIDIPGKGLFSRLMAGPMNSSAQTKNVCIVLKSKQQYCVPYHQK